MAAEMGGGALNRTFFSVPLWNGSDLVPLEKPAHVHPDSKWGLNQSRQSHGPLERINGMHAWQTKRIYQREGAARRTSCCWNV